MQVFAFVPTLMGAPGHPVMLTPHLYAPTQPPTKSGFWCYEHGDWRRSSDLEFTAAVSMAYGRATGARDASIEERRPLSGRLTVDKLLARAQILAHLPEFEASRRAEIANSQMGLVKALRSDEPKRWEHGLRAIVSTFTGPREEFEIGDVVTRAKALIRKGFEVEALGQTSDGEGSER